MHISVIAAILISMAIAELPYWLYRINALARKLNPLLIRRCFSLPRIGVFNSLTRAQSRREIFYFSSACARGYRMKYSQTRKRDVVLTMAFVILFLSLSRMRQINIFAFDKIFFSPSLNRTRLNSASAAIDFQYCMQRGTNISKIFILRKRV